MRISQFAESKPWRFLAIATPPYLVDPCGSLGDHFEPILVPLLATFRTRVPSSAGGVQRPPFNSSALRRSISKRGSTGSRDKLPPTFFLRGSRKDSITTHFKRPPDFNKRRFPGLAAARRSLQPGRTPPGGNPGSRSGSPVRWSPRATTRMKMTHDRPVILIFVRSSGLCDRIGTEFRFPVWSPLDWPARARESTPLFFDSRLFL